MGKWDKETIDKLMVYTKKITILIFSILIIIHLLNIPCLAGPATKLQILLPGEVGAPGSAPGGTGKTAALPIDWIAGISTYVIVNAVDDSWNVVPSTATVIIKTGDPNDMPVLNQQLINGTTKFMLTMVTAYAYWTITSSDVAANLQSITSAGVEVIPGPVCKVAFTTPSRKLLSGSTVFLQSNKMTVQTQDQYGNFSRVEDAILLNFNSTSPNGRFTTDGTQNWKANMTLPEGYYEASFWYSDTIAGNHQLNVYENPAEGWTDAVQISTVVPNIPHHFDVWDSGDDGLASVYTDEWIYIQVMDAYNNQAIGDPDYPETYYVGVVTFTATSASASCFHDDHDVDKAGNTYTFELDEYMGGGINEGGRIKFKLNDTRVTEESGLLGVEIVNPIVITVKDSQELLIAGQSEEITMRGAWITPYIDQVDSSRVASPNIYQGAVNELMERLDIRTNSGQAEWEGLRVDLEGTADEEDITSIRLWKDMGDSGFFEAPIPQDPNNELGESNDIFLASATFNGSGVALLTFPANKIQIINEDVSRYFLTIDISEDAVVDEYMQLVLSDRLYFEWGMPPSPQLAANNFEIRTPTSTIKLSPGEVLVEPFFGPQYNLPESTGTVNQGNNYVGLLGLRMHTEKYTVPFNRINITLTGSGRVEDIESISIYRDRETDPASDGYMRFDYAVDDLISSGNNVFHSEIGIASINVDTPDINKSTHTFFVVVNIAENATKGDMVGIEISAPNSIEGLVVYRGAVQNQVLEYYDYGFDGYQNRYESAIETPAFGADGKPGIAGIDDDGNGVIDDVGEHLWAGSDDFVPLAWGIDGKPGIASLDDDGNGIVDNISEYYFGGEGTTDDNWDYMHDDYDPVSRSTGTESNYRKESSESLRFPMDSLELEVVETSDLLRVEGRPPQISRVKQNDENRVLMELLLHTTSKVVTWTGLRVDKLGTCDDADIKNIKIWYYVSGSTDAIGNPVVETSTNTPTGFADLLLTNAYTTFQDGVANILINPANYQSITNIQTSPVKKFLITLDMEPLAVENDTVGLRVGYTYEVDGSTDTYFKLNDDIDNVQAYTPFSVGPVPIYDCPDKVSLEGQLVLAEETLQGELEILLKLTMTANLSYARWNGIKLKLDGDCGIDDLGNIKVYADYDMNGTWSTIVDRQLNTNAGDFSVEREVDITFDYDEANSSYDGGEYLRTIRTYPKIFFIIGTVANDAAIDKEFGVIIESADFVTVDSPNEIASFNDVNGNGGQDAGEEDIYPISSGRSIIKPSQREMTVTPLNIALGQDNFNPGGIVNVMISDDIDSSRELTNSIFPGDTSINVKNTDGFPVSGVIGIDNSGIIELIKYDSITDNSFVNCTRGYLWSEPANHNVDLMVGLPAVDRGKANVPMFRFSLKVDNYYIPWEGIEIIDFGVDEDIVSVKIIKDVEADPQSANYGTFQATDALNGVIGGGEFVNGKSHITVDINTELIGNQPEIVYSYDKVLLSSLIDDTTTYIPVQSTVGFPASGVLEIDTEGNIEYMKYISKGDNYFVIEDNPAGRGWLGSASSSHPEGTQMTFNPQFYFIVVEVSNNAVLNRNIDIGINDRSGFRLGDIHNVMPDNFPFNKSPIRIIASGENVPPYEPYAPLCEGESNPEYVDLSPEFSWTFSDSNTGNKQSAFRILVSSHSSELSLDSGSMWDSGKTAVSISTIAFAGSTLEWETTYYWKVMTWDSYGSSGPYCSAQTFYTLGVNPPYIIQPLCENRYNPVNLVNPFPDFSWVFGDIDSADTQKAYRVIVSTSISSITLSSGEMWDSGETMSAASSEIAYAGSALTPDTSYYWRVKAWDNWGTEGSFSAIRTFHFKQDYTLNPVFNLTAAPLDGNRIILSWEQSTSNYLLKYNMYYSSSIINYAVPQAMIYPSIESWISPVLLNSVTYYFVVRAENIYHHEEKNRGIVSAVTLSSLADVLKAEIVNPKNGTSITGQRVTVIAELFKGETNEVQNIYFQYKSSNALSWSNIAHATDSNPNPDSVTPYFIHWDVSDMAEGRYNIRAVAVDNDNTGDPHPMVKTIIVDHGDPDVEESIVNNCHQKRVKIDNRRHNEIKAGEGGSNRFTKVEIVAGVITSDISTIKIIINPPDIPASKETIRTISEFREIEIEDAELSGSITITIPYADDDNDGIIDDTSLYEDSLKIYHYNLVTGSWEEDTSTVIDKDNNECICTPDHLSLFGIFSSQASSLGEARAYPNPCKPGLGHTEVIFDQLTSNTSVRIYTIAGDLVWEEESINSGSTTWDCNNQSDNTVSSGMYVCLITNNIGQKQIIKVSIIK